MHETLPQIDSKTEAWFDDLVATLRSHEVQLHAGIATPETKKFYETVFAGNADEIAHYGKSMAQKYFVPRIIIDFLGMIKGLATIKVAFDYNDSELLVWAEINENDETTERSILVSQAHINAKYHPYGFDMETTIVESDDKLTIPNHYKIFKA